MMRSRTILEGVRELCTTRTFNPVVCVHFLHSSSSPSFPAVAVASIIKDDYIKHHSDVTERGETYNFVNNQFIKSSTDRWIDLRDPATQQIVTRVPETTYEEMVAAVDSSKEAFKTWKNTTLLTRQQIMFRLAALIRENWDRLAASITLEQVV